VGVWVPGEYYELLEGIAAAPLSPSAIPEVFWYVVAVVVAIVIIILKAFRARRL